VVGGVALTALSPGRSRAHVGLASRVQPLREGFRPNRRDPVRESAPVRTALSFSSRLSGRIGGHDRAAAVFSGRSSTGRSRRESTPAFSASPRGNGKSWLSAHILTRCLTPGDPFNVPGAEYLLGAGSLDQARFVFRFVRAALEPTERYGVRPPEPAPEPRPADAGRRYHVMCTRNAPVHGDEPWPVPWSNECCGEWACVDDLAVEVLRQERNAEDEEWLEQQIAGRQTVP
jgi:hypothetical protein